MSNSNFNITKVTVDPTSQEITNLEINGKAFESGGAELENVVFDEYNPLNVVNIFGDKATEVEIHPSSDYDGIKKVTIFPDGITGYPGEGLEIRDNPELEVQWVSEDTDITIPEGTAWTGTITLHKGREP